MKYFCGMVYRKKTLLSASLGFLAVAGGMFALQWLVCEFGWLCLGYRVHILIFFLSLLLCATCGAAYLLKVKEIGFIYLAFIIVKMFALGFITVYYSEFRENVIAYFVLIWLYIAADLLFTVKLLRE
ncbi:hypothetical protein SAMN05443429_105123 [Cruoricaptor ignavus]|uniref:Uncharacterized protein n=1 Tax=Cruoricaptor ignavus TaxID=1118202 RepID=A0A1M6EJ73_9FLAO|nr:hypothetical protein [Cruoricaptor ignavus]SHI85513.1 hypothetical protein SAMN05443429_105123 [Cruoricaptor ignavus]